MPGDGSASDLCDRGGARCWLLALLSVVFDCHTLLGRSSQLDALRWPEFHALLCMFSGGSVMSTSAIGTSPASNLSPDSSSGDELVALGWEINADQYRIVHAAARFDEDLEWLRRGHRSASVWISTRLQVQTSTAAEWVRVGHALRHLPLVDAALPRRRSRTRRPGCDPLGSDDEQLLGWLVNRGSAHCCDKGSDVAKPMTSATPVCTTSGPSRRGPTGRDDRGAIVLAPSVAKPVVCSGRRTGSAYLRDAERSTRLNFGLGRTASTTTLSADRV